MSNFKNSKRVKLSSADSGIKTEDEDEASAVEEKQPIAGCSDSAKLKTAEDASVIATATGNSGTANGSALVEDFLMQIFDTDFFDVTDLLNFRLVNRLWRDCATAVMLRTSACQISFNIEFNARKAFYCENNNSDALLSDLNDIISESPKFPCSSFRFVNSYCFGDAHDENKIDTSSLFDFFSVHGNNIKTITVGDRILKRDLRSLLLNYAPGLERLDLQYLKSFGDTYPARFHQTLSPKSVPNLKTLVLGPCPDFNLMELVNAALNLESVENTRVADLKLLLDHGKVGLIKKLEYCLYTHDDEEFPVFHKLAYSQPKLTNLIVFPVEHTREGIKECEESRYTMPKKAYLKILLNSSKDTLKYLEFRSCPLGEIIKLRPPVLKNLECLKLVQYSYQNVGPISIRPYSKLSQLDYANSYEGRGHTETWPNHNFECLKEVTARIFGICPKQAANKFPNLRKLKLELQNYGAERDGSLQLLHTCRSLNKKIGPHFYKTVKIFELYSALPKTLRRAKAVSDFFGNVTILKIKCESVQDLHCSLWVLSPLAKSIEIYGISNSDRYNDRYESDDSESESQWKELHLVDSFFTGFPAEMCKKLQMTHFPNEIEENPLVQNFIRTRPSICDLENLTDLKIHFTKLRATFASHVTDDYAFRAMPDTTITFAHASPTKCDAANCEMRKYLNDISNFVHLTYRKLPKHFDNKGDRDRDRDLYFTE